MATPQDHEKAQGKNIAKMHVPKNKYKSDLYHFRQTTESFSEFQTELKRKFELAKNKSTGAMTTETAVPIWLAMWKMN